VETPFDPAISEAINFEDGFGLGFPTSWNAEFTEDGSGQMRRQRQIHRIVENILALRNSFGESVSYLCDVRIQDD
jgi:hypothetical protein